MIAPACSACFIYFICLALLAPVFRSNVFYLGEQEAVILQLVYFPVTTTKTAFCPGSIWPFVPVLEPGFGRRDKSAGGFCPGW